jgi:hypothetical protein
MNCSTLTQAAGVYNRNVSELNEAIIDALWLFTSGLILYGNGS